MRRKRMLALLLAVTLAMPLGINVPNGMQKVFAVDFTVTDSSAVMYSTGTVKVYSQPDTKSTVVTTLTVNVPVKVTGITSNGWFRVSINGTYYIEGSGLSTEQTTTQVVSSTDLTSLTKGTFSFYKNNTLSKFDKDDVTDMDENTYIKYLDSFLMGYAMLDYCILADSGKYLKEVYEKQTQYTTMQSYLIDYRNTYFSNSLIGPFRSESELKRALNRAIRYDISEFNSVYKNSNVGSADDTKMENIIKGVVDDIKAEQGVTFSYEKSYGSYKLSDGTEGKGWIIGFTKKD
jgi:hypothetical protein